MEGKVEARDLDLEHGMRFGSVLGIFVWIVIHLSFGLGGLIVAVSMGETGRRKMSSDGKSGILEFVDQ